MKSQLESEKVAYKKLLDVDVQKFNTKKLSAVYSTYSTQSSESNQLSITELNAVKNLMIDDLQERLK